MAIRRAAADRKFTKEMCHEKFITTIALISLLTIPAIESANAALVSPSSSAFGDNGY
jgi:hypothetical protein